MSTCSWSPLPLQLSDHLVSQLKTPFLTSSPTCFIPDHLVWSTNASAWLNVIYPSPKVDLRWNQSNRAHAVTACIGLWCHRLMHAPHRLMHACTACIAPWCHRLMHAVTALALLLWFCLGYTFICSYFALLSIHRHLWSSKPGFQLGFCDTSGERVYTHLI